MKNINELNRRLVTSDRKLIAAISGVPYETVKKILNGRRNSETPQGRKVINAALIVIRNREKLLAKR